MAQAFLTHQSQPQLIHEEFGDGIMSAVDFSMDIVRQPAPKGDRVNVVLSGKFVPYRQC